VPLYAIILSFGVSAVIGISFGVLPARSAAKMDPVEAMRYE
jgi:putative ABC transport system permease protein